jgi:hypothetical protein
MAALRTTECHLIIETSVYQMVGLGPGVFRLWSLHGKGQYDVTTDEGRVTCTCPDYRHRRRDAGETCKHGDALVLLGMLPAPADPGVTNGT